MKVDLLSREMVDSDLGAVNAARVSFAKESDKLSDRDRGLIRYLYNKVHWSPLAHPHLHLLIPLIQSELEGFATCDHPGLRIRKHGVFGYIVSGSAYAFVNNLRRFCSIHQDHIRVWIVRKFPEIAYAAHIIAMNEETGDVIEVPENQLPRDLQVRTLRIQAPIFVARQLVKHQVNLVWNEVSRRYVDDTPTFWRPKKWRERANKIKQGSSDQPIKGNWFACFLLGLYERLSVAFYNLLLRMKTAPELARIVLPLTLNTEWWWTGTLDAFDRVLALRLDPHAQAETREVALLMKEALYDSV